MMRAITALHGRDHAVAFSFQYNRSEVTIMTKQATKILTPQDVYDAFNGK